MKQKKIIAAAIKDWRSGKFQDNPLFPRRARFDQSDKTLSLNFAMSGSTHVEREDWGEKASVDVVLHIPDAEQYRVAQGRREKVSKFLTSKNVPEVVAVTIRFGDQKASRPFTCLTFSADGVVDHDDSPVGNSGYDLKKVASFAVALIKFWAQGRVRSCDFPRMSVEMYR